MVVCSVVLSGVRRRVVYRILRVRDTPLGFTMDHDQQRVWESEEVDRETEAAYLPMIRRSIRRHLRRE